MAGFRQQGPMCQIARPNQVVDGTMSRTAMPRPGSAGASSDGIGQWDVGQKLLEAARRAGPKLPADARAQFAELFSPTNVKITLAVLAAWAASHACGVGEFADGVLLLFGVATVGIGAFSGGAEVGRYLNIASNAQREGDLDLAASHLAQGLILLGVTTFVALIMKKGGRGKIAAVEEGSLELDLLTQDVLRRVFGSAENVGKLPRENVRTIVQFFSKYNVKDGNVAEWTSLIKAIDLHATQPVKIVQLDAGEIVGSYVASGGRVGQWLVRAQGAVSDRNLGLSGAGRTYKRFRVKAPVEVLETKAGPMADTWTQGRTRTGYNVTSVADDAAGAQGKVKDVAKAAEHVAGGGTQHFLPEAWKFLEPIE